MNTLNPMLNLDLPVVPVETVVVPSRLPTEDVAPSVVTSDPVVVSDSEYAVELNNDFVVV